MQACFAMQSTHAPIIAADGSSLQQQSKMKHCHSDHLVSHRIPPHHLPRNLSDPHFHSNFVSAPIGTAGIGIARSGRSIKSLKSTTLWSLSSQKPFMTKYARAETHSADWGLRSRTSMQSDDQLNCFSSRIMAFENATMQANDMKQSREILR